MRELRHRGRRREEREDEGDVEPAAKPALFIPFGPWEKGRDGGMVRVVEMLKTGMRDAVSCVSGCILPI